MSGKNWKAYLALGIICIVWGTTYLALGIGVKTIPPFIFSGLRQVTAGGVLLMVMYFMGKARNITRKDWMIQAVPGLLMIAMGNGLIGWAEMYIPTGLAALIVAILPVYVVILNYLLSREKKIPNRDVIIGLILGCLGIFLIFRDNLKDLFNPEYLSGMLLCFLSCLAWAFGTLFIKKRKPSHHPLVNASMQMFTGGLWLLLIVRLLLPWAPESSLSLFNLFPFIHQDSWQAPVKLADPEPALPGEPEGYLPSTVPGTSRDRAEPCGTQGRC